MISQLEVLRSLFGAWRLARLDTGGMSYFERTPEGALRSFTAALLVLPLFIAYQADLLPGEIERHGFATAITVEGLFYVIQWTLFPVLMATILAVFGLPGKYIDFLVAYNWSNVIQALFYLPPLLLHWLTPAPAQLIDAGAFAALALALAYSWYVIRTATGLGGSVVVGLVVLYLVLSIVIRVIARGFLDPALS